MENGELALGQNVTIAFMTWHGYNYEDAIIMSEKMQSQDYYTRTVFEVEIPNAGVGVIAVTSTNLPSGLDSKRRIASKEIFAL